MHAFVALVFTDAAIFRTYNERDAVSISVATAVAVVLANPTSGDSTDRERRFSDDSIKQAGSCC